MKWMYMAAGLLIALMVAVLVAYRTVPDHTTDATHFDTLIVLGCPTRGDGTPSLEQRERVLEAVREFQAGRAPHMIITGAAAHNPFTEADVMAKLAEAQGVPAAAIEEDRQALNTIQNVYYSRQIMQRHGWKTAEVISSPNHLPRAALILSHWNFAWRTHTAHWPVEYSARQLAWWNGREALATAELRWFGFRASPFLPADR